MLASRAIRSASGFLNYRRATPHDGALRLALQADQECAGGYVVRRVTMPSQGYVQVLEYGKPARCSGRYRVR